MGHDQDQGRRLDAGGSSVNLGTDSTSPFSVNWNTTLTTDAPHTLTTVAAAVSVTVKNTLSPLTISLGIAPQPVLKKANETITATVATDSTATITKVDFYINGTLVGTDSTGPIYIQPWKVPAAPNRTYTIYGVVTDSLGRTMTSSLLVLNP